MVSYDNLTREPELTRKFVSRHTRPFNIIGKASLLCRYCDPDKVFFGRQIHPLALTLTDKDVEYTVELILAKRISHGTTQY